MKDFAAGVIIGAVIGACGVFLSLAFYAASGGL